MESTESRFFHLLQPIRELTKNWDVDVASELNDYLEELDEMCITFDGGKTRLNFAEAALLIQGSTCIYSKKVEMLHNLVYQTLEYINDRNKKRNKEVAVSQEDGSAAVQEDDDDDEEAMFSPLDINASDNLEMSESNTKVMVVPLPPESLIPSETHEKRKLPLISLKGEILCSLKDFRMNQFIPGDNNMIILRLCSTSSKLDRHGEPRQQECRDAVPAGAAADADRAVENFLPLDEEGMEVEQEVEQEVEERVERQQAQSDGWLLRERRRAEAGQERREEKAPPPVSVWTLHDAYAQLGGDKPFQAGKSYKVPEGLDEGGKRKRKRERVQQDFTSWFRGVFDPPQHKLKNGPTFTDLNYVYFTTMKDKLKSRRRVCRKAGVVISDEELRRTFLQPEEAELHQQGEEPLDGFRHPGLLGPDGDDSDTEQEVFGEDAVAGLDAARGGVSPESQRDELNYEDLVKLRVEQLVVTSRGYTQETALSRRVKDWEDKIRPELLQQEERPPFDIHDYGDQIVSALSSVGRRRTFASIVSGLDNFEACKFLLASLQLANDYTVEVESAAAAAGLDERLDSMSLTLLSTHRAADRFKQLKASS